MAVDVVLAVLVISSVCYGVVFFARMLFRQRSLLVEAKRQIDELMGLNKDLLEFCHRNEEMAIAERTIRMLVAMMLCAERGDVEKFSFFNNRLLFMGIPKPVLENVDKMNQFIDDLLNLRYEIIREKNDSPYQYSFVLKKKSE